MQTVEQNQNPITDDGRMVPQESGMTGEISSDAGSREDARREWEALIGSEKYHALYTEHISEIIKKRLKTERDSRQLLDRAAELLGLENPEQLPARITELLTPATRDWQSEVAGVQEKYPEFDLQAESRDPDFAGLLQSFAHSPSVSLIRLYELFHLDKLTAAAAETAASAAASQLLGAVQVRRARPDELGLHKSSPFEAQRASHLTRAQRAMLAQRAAKGEKITF